MIQQCCVKLEAGAVGRVLDNWKSQWPQMGLLALVPEAEKDGVALLQTQARARQLPLCGAVFPALVTDHGFVNDGVWLICFSKAPATLLVPELAQNGLPKLVAGVEQLLPMQASRDSAAPPTMFLVFDGLLPNIGTLLDGLYQARSGGLLYAGVNAGSETFQSIACVFDADQCLAEAALALLLPTGSEVVLSHGYPVSERLMMATSTLGNRVDSIDHQPAFEVYQSVIRQEYGVNVTRDNFYEHAVHFPFGVITAIDVLVRIPVAFNDDGSLICVGEVPPNSMLRLLRAPDLNSSECVANIASALHAQAGDPAGTGALLTFYCAGRRMHFGAAAVEELAQLKSATGSSCLFGALTLGEIDSLKDLRFPRFHNAAMLCLPVAV